MTLAPVIKRFLESVVMPSLREADNLKVYVESMIAVLDVIDLLQGCKIKGSVTPQELMDAIKKHLDLFKRAYGEDAMRPKHHYALHLPDILHRFGILLATFVNERKHRAVIRYSRGRNNTKNFELGVLEEVTCHNMWELSDKFWHAFSTSKPSRQQTWWLQDMFPGVGDGFTLHNEVSMNGLVTVGDVIVFELDDELRIGEMFLNIGLAHDASMWSIVSVWEEHPPTVPNPDCINFTVRDEIIKIPTINVITSLTHRMSADRTSCVVILPKHFVCA